MTAMSSACHGAPQLPTTSCTQSSQMSLTPPGGISTSPPPVPSSSPSMRTAGPSRPGPRRWAQPDGPYEAASRNNAALPRRGLRWRARPRGLCLQPCREIPQGIPVPGHGSEHNLPVGAIFVFRVIFVRPCLFRKGLVDCEHTAVSRGGRGTFSDPN